LKLRSIKNRLNHFTLTKLIIIGLATILALFTIVNITVLLGIHGIVKSYETIVENDAVRTNQVDLERILNNFNYIYQFALNDISQTKSLTFDNGTALMSSLLDIDVNAKEILSYLNKNNSKENNQSLLKNLRKSLAFTRRYKSTNDIDSVEALNDISNGINSLRTIIYNDVLPLLSATVDSSTEQAKATTNIAIWIIIGFNLLIFGLVVLLILIIRSVLTKHRVPIIETATFSANSAQDVSRYTFANKEAVNQIKEVFSEMSRAFEGITESTQDSTVGIQKITESTEKAAQSLKTLSDHALTIFENLNQNQNEIQGSEDHLMQLRDKINESTDRIQTNAEIADALHDRIVTLTTQVEGIDEILQTIDNIKEQTTMLSLNAGIEAARAGEHGRGFEIVAKRIRNLSEQTGESTSAIQEIIHNVQTSVVEVETAMAKVIEGVKRSVEEINQVSAEFNELQQSNVKVQTTIKSIMQQANLQLNATRDIEESSEKITNEVQQISALSQEVYASMEELSVEAENALEQLKLVDDNIQQTSEIANNQELLARKVNEHVALL
jgi:methyl-accepting chemotaxis protein